MTTDILQQLRRLRIVPLIVIDDPDRAVPLARALINGGLSCAEIAFRTPGAQEALRRIAVECPDILLGAGTVLTVPQAKAARQAGAHFVVAPGFSERVVRYCQEQAIPVFPGVCTPTEIEAALACDVTVVKFFPAEPMGGLPFLKAVAAPYGGVEFLPTGGINAANLSSYLAFDRVVACGGSWMAPQSWIDAGEFDRIRDEVVKAVAAVATLTPSR